MLWSMRRTTFKACKYTNKRIKRNRKRKERQLSKEQSTPIKHYVWCAQCGRKKHLYKSQKAAEMAIMYNVEEMKKIGKELPSRAYYCVACGGWHLTSKKYNPKGKHGTKSF